MTDVLLINCPIAFDVEGQMGDETTNPPLGLLYIASYLEKNDISVKAYDVRAENLSIKKLIREIKKEKPKVVGMSAMTPSIRSAVELASEIRKQLGARRPKIALGGAHLSADPEFVKRFPVFDFGVVGEGEVVFTKLVKKILKKQKVSGVYFADPIRDLDDLPFPARHLIDKANYFGASSEDKPSEERAKSLYASIIGSRGCPFRCSFCSKPVHKNLCRTRSPENVFKEMEEIYDQYGGFIFMDDTTTLRKDNILKLCDLIIKSGKKYQWMAMTRANCVDEKVIEMMAKAGCHDLFFGVESGNERIRNEVIKKSVDDKEIIKAMRWCRKHGIQTNIFLMLGFPGETMSEIEDTVNFGRKAMVDFIGIHLTVPLPGAEIFQTAIKEGKLPKSIIDDYASGKMGKSFKGAWPVYVPDGLTQNDLINAKKRTYRRFYFDPGWISRRMKYDLKHFKSLVQDLKMIKTGIYALLHGETKYSMS